MYFHKTPWLLKILYPQLVWDKYNDEKKLYLTFDDGPVPKVTSLVLDILDKYHAKASFFCVGENIRRNPGLFREIHAAGHSVGNHTFNHLNGWKTPDNLYLENINKCEKLISEILPNRPTKLIRPPYGRITRSQIKMLIDHFRIIMWDYLVGDFDKNLDPKWGLDHARKKTKDGSIIIFHDSLKAEKNLRFMLPVYLEYFVDMGYQFKAL